MSPNLVCPAWCRNLASFSLGFEELGRGCLPACWVSAHSVQKPNCAISRAQLFGFPGSCHVVFNTPWAEGSITISFGFVIYASYHACVSWYATSMCCIFAFKCSACHMEFRDVTCERSFGARPGGLFLSLAQVLSSKSNISFRCACASAFLSRDP